MAPSPKRSDSHASDPLKSAPVTCCTRSIALPRPCWARWSNHFPAFRPVASVMLKPSAFQRSRSALSCWKPRASSTSGKGKTRMRSAMPFCWTSAFGPLALPALLPAVASAAFRAVRSLGRGARAMVGRSAPRCSRPAPRPTPRGSSRRAGGGRSATARQGRQSGRSGGAHAHAGRCCPRCREKGPEGPQRRHSPSAAVGSEPRRRSTSGRSGGPPHRAGR